MKNLEKKIKLEILKGGFLLASSALIKAGVMEYQLKWLRNYVAGTGKDMIVPEEIVVEAKQVFQEAIIHCWTNGETKYDSYPCWIDAEVGTLFAKKYCVYNSMLYDGIGFCKKVVLFYLLGGFTFRLNEDGTVSGKDVYDWHPRPDGKFYSSPLGNENGRLDWLYKCLDKIFGHDWFSNKNLTKKYGVSNKLWCDMAEVGAKAFTSYFNDVRIPGLISPDILASYYMEQDCRNEKFEQVSNLERATLENAGVAFDKIPAYKSRFGVFYTNTFNMVFEEAPRKWSWSREMFAREAGIKLPDADTRSERPDRRDNRDNKRNNRRRSDRNNRGSRRPQGSRPQR